MSVKPVIETLNELLASANVFARKVKHYHWDVKGPNFFTLHAEFEKLYDQWAEFADQIAERVVAIGGKPLPTLAADLKHSSIKEDATIPNAETMVERIVDDLSALVSEVDAAFAVVDKAEDDTTADLLDDIRDAIEAKLWMLKAYLG